MRQPTTAWPGVLRARSEVVVLGGLPARRSVCRGRWSRRCGPTSSSWQASPRVRAVRRPLCLRSISMTKRPSLWGLSVVLRPSNIGSTVDVVLAQDLGGLSQRRPGVLKDVAPLVRVLDATVQLGGSGQVRPAVEVAGGPPFAVLAPGLGLRDAGREADRRASPRWAAGRGSSWGCRGSGPAELVSNTPTSFSSLPSGPPSTLSEHRCGFAAGGGRRSRASCSGIAGGPRSGPCGCRPGG